MQLVNSENEVAELETQLRIMSQAAADAIERANQLEIALESVRSIPKSSSSSSLDSNLSSYSAPSTPTDRLNTLEAALDTILKSRCELAKPYNYQYY